MNLGVYGIMSVFMNGFNLIIVYMIVPSLYYSIVFQCAPIMYLVCSVCVYMWIVPYYVMSSSGSGWLWILVISGMGFMVLWISAISGLSMYVLLGGFRIISQLVSFEFIYSCVVWVWVYGDYGCGWME